MFSDDRIEFLALLVAGIKFPDREWAALNEHTRCVARRIACQLATDLKAGL